MSFFKNMKNAALRKVMTAQMKKSGADEAQIKFLTELIESDPDLFERIGKEIEERTKAGEDQMKAAQAVMLKYQADLQRTMMKNPSMLQRARLEALRQARKPKK